jgi:hypothetical protein
MQRSLARLAALVLAAGLWLPAVPVRAEDGARIAAASAVKAKPKPKPKAVRHAPRRKSVQHAPKPRHKAAVKPKAKKAASPPPLRSGLQAAQALAEPGGSPWAPTLVKSGSC